MAPLTARVHRYLALRANCFKVHRLWRLPTPSRLGGLPRRAASPPRYAMSRPVSAVLARGGRVWRPRLPSGQRWPRTPAVATACRFCLLYVGSGGREREDRRAPCARQPADRAARQCAESDVPGAALLAGVNGIYSTLERTLRRLCTLTDARVHTHTHTLPCKQCARAHGATGLDCADWLRRTGTSSCGNSRAGWTSRARN